MYVVANAVFKTCIGYLTFWNVMSVEGPNSRKNLKLKGEIPKLRGAVKVYEANFTPMR